MDDTEGQPAPEQKSPAPAAETAQGDDDVLAELESTLSESEGSDAAVDDQAAAGSEDEELEDFEDGGKKAKLPKWVKARVMQQADYTRKTTAVAEERKAVEAERKAIAEEARFHRENVVAVAKLVGLDEQLEAFRKIAPEQWDAMPAEQAAKLQTKFNLLKDQRERAVGELQQKQHQALEKQRQSDAKQYEDGLARIAKKVPGWSDELAGKLNDYATGIGIPLDELQGIVPRKNSEAYVDALRKAMLFDQLMARTRAKAKQPEAAEPIQPVPTVRPRRSPASPLPQDSDSMEDWVRKEKARMRKMHEARA